MTTLIKLLPLVGAMMTPPPLARVSGLDSTHRAFKGRLTWAKDRRRSITQNNAPGSRREPRRYHRAASSSGSLSCTGPSRDRHRSRNAATRHEGRRRAPRLGPEAPTTPAGAAVRWEAEHASVRDDEFEFSERSRVSPDPATGRPRWRPGMRGGQPGYERLSGSADRPA